MTAIFLRLTEYFSGVLFLTTNRVQAFDQAFASRVSVALEYHPLDLETRTQVFANLLDAAGEHTCFGCVLMHSCIRYTMHTVGSLCVVTFLFCFFPFFSLLFLQVWVPRVALIRAISPRQT